jgi:hypothetical protein
VPEEPLAQPGWLTELEEQRRIFREEVEARQNVMVPSEDSDWEDEGPAWRVWKPSATRSSSHPSPRSGPPTA